MRECPFSFELSGLLRLFGPLLASPRWLQALEMAVRDDRRYRLLNAASTLAETVIQ